MKLNIIVIVGRVNVRIFLMFGIFEVMNYVSICLKKKIIIIYYYLNNYYGIWNDIIVL